MHHPLLGYTNSILEQSRYYGVLISSVFRLCHGQPSQLMYDHIGDLGTSCDTLNRCTISKPRGCLFPISTPERLLSAVLAVDRKGSHLYCEMTPRPDSRSLNVHHVLLRFETITAVFVSHPTFLW